jgi:large subunit ribosomal protein L23
MREPRDVIIRPVVTERSTQMADEHGTYAFVVSRDANKIEIRHALEKLFSVRVKSVRTMNCRGKLRRVGRDVGRRAAYKKAIIRLVEGERIDVYEGV